MGVASPIVTPGRLAAVVIAMIAAAELVLISTVLNPRTFFSGDPGVKYLQAEALVQSRWRQLAVADPSASIVPDGRFSPLQVNQFKRVTADAPWYGLYSELFTVPVSLGLAWFGMRGLYLVPLLAGVATMILTYRLAACVAPRIAWLAPGLLGACSPMLFYSVDLWEHTLSVLCTTGAILLVIAEPRGDVRLRYAGAGVLLGLAIALREELYAMVPAGLVALAWVERPRRLRALLAAALGAVAILVPHWWVKSLQTGGPGRRVVAVLLGWAPEAVTMGGEQVETLRAALAFIVPPSPGWVLALLLIVIGRWAVARLGARAQRGVSVGLVLAIATWGIVAVLRARRWETPYSLTDSFPPVLYLTFLAAPLRAPREVRQLLAISAVFIATLCVAMQWSMMSVPAGGAQWGPRYLMPVLPPCAALIVFALERRGEWRRALPSPLAVATFAVLVLAGLAVQVQGIRALALAKRQYEQLAARWERIEPGQLLVSDIWWFPMATATVLRQHPVVAVQGRGASPLDDLLPLLQERDVRALTLVSHGASADAAAQVFAAAGWTEVRRDSELAWLEVRFVEYRREGARPRAAAATR